LHSLLTEAEFSSCWVTLQIGQSNPASMHAHPQSILPPLIPSCCCHK
jgi:hypothetical protein